MSVACGCFDIKYKSILHLMQHLFLLVISEYYVCFHLILNNWLSPLYKKLSHSVSLVLVVTPKYHRIKTAEAVKLVNEPSHERVE